MKKVLSLFILLVAFTSCTEDVKFNNPALQGLKDNVLWRAKDSRAAIGTDGSLTIKGYSENEIVTLKTSSVNIGTYVLGTTNPANTASYVLSNGLGNTEYQTVVVPGSVDRIILSAAGSGYAVANSVSTTGGTGFGLKVNIKTSASGAVNEVKVISPGNGYTAGDVITISGGNNDAKFIVQNVTKSNGEIVITNFDGATITGTFKFNAVKTSSDLTAPEVLNFQEGVFYKVPIYPSL